jgi:GNAT superfamily N-acetyltransferase
VDVVYQLESYPSLGVEEFIDVLRRSTLAERRPVDEPETMRGMLEQADVIVTARVGGLLVGISRAITDYHFCTYLSDLAVDQDYQRQGMGKQLIRLTHETAGRNTTLILLAAPKARTYYPHIGMNAHDSCWIMNRESSARPPAAGQVARRPGETEASAAAQGKG